MRWLSILIPLLVAPIGCGDPTASPPGEAGVTDTGAATDAAGDAEGPRAFDAFLEWTRTYARDKGIPGLAVAVVVDGKLAHAAGVGTKVAGTDDPIGPHTRFRVASMTKMIVASGVMQLVEQGKLALVDTLATRVPWMKLVDGFDPKTITLAQLLSHTSGLPDGLGLSCATGAGALEGWYTAAGPFPLWSPPGRLWNYSNHNYAMAAAAIEGATGKVFTDVLTTAVLGPLGMADATFEPKVAAAGDHVQGHQKAGTAGAYKPVPIDRYDCASLRAAGGLYASAEDYAHLAEAFLAGGRGVLGKASVAAMSSKVANLGQGPTTNYGYGLVTFDWRGETVVSHDGALPGFLSTVMWLPARGFGVVVLANADVASVEPVALQAVDRFLGLTRAPTTYPSEPATWGRYAGDYTDPWAVLGATKVVLSGGSLSLVYGADATPVPLTYAAGDTFVGEFLAFGTKLGVTFSPDATGATEYVVTRVGVARRTAAGWVFPKPAARVQRLGELVPGIPRMDEVLVTH